MLPKSAPRQDAERQNSHSNPDSNPYAPAPCGSVAKIARKEVEKGDHVALARFGSVFRLFWA
jgi:transcriptional regulator NrdR family protein